MSQASDSWLSGLGIDVGGILEAARQKFKEVKGSLEEAKKVADADYGSGTHTQSYVEPGAAEESLKDFAQDVKSTSKKLKRVTSALDALEGESDLAKAVGQSSKALDQVAEGLDKVGEGAGKVLEVAETARKLEECRQVLIRVQAVDFTQTDRRVENAQAMGDLAKVFGDFGAEATKEVPMLKGYFQLISRLGEIWVPIARMTVRREKELDEAATSDRDQMPVPAPEKGTAADTSRVIALAEVATFLDEQFAVLDRTGNPGEVERGRRILDDHHFDENFNELLAGLKRSHGVAAEVLHFIAEKTTFEPSNEKWLQDDLARSWQPCHEAVVALRDGFDRRWNFVGVTFEPAVRALEAARPKKAA